MNHLNSLTNQHPARPQWIAITAISMLLAIVPCTDARAARVVNLPASGNAADPQLAMTESGAYAITWRQQPTFGENERVYAQTGTIARPFKSKPTSPGLTKNLIGPLPTVATSGRAGLAWLGGTGTDVGVRFFGPKPSKARTVAWVEAGKSVIVAKLSSSGQLVSRTVAHSETTAAELSGARLGLDLLGNSTAIWSREAIECVGPEPDPTACVPAAVFAATGNSTGGFDPPQLIAPGCESAQIVEAPTGAATIVASCGTQLRASHRAPGQPFNESVQLAPAGAAESGQFSLALGLGKSVLVAYETANSFEAQTVRANLVLAAGTIGHSFANPRIIRRGIRFETANNPRPSPRLIVTKRGRAYLRWLQDDHTKLASIKSSKRLGKSLTVPGYDRRGLNTMDAEVSITDRGKALAVWNFISIKIDPAVRATTFVAPRT